MRTTSAGRPGRVALAAAALAAAWLLTPAAVPLYDGVGFPDEPYRYVVPPTGYRTTPPPTRAFGSVPAAKVAAGTAAGSAATPTPGAGTGSGTGADTGAGTTGAHSASTRDIGVKSAEFGPQVELYVAKGALTGPAGARGYQISAIPVAPSPGAAGGQVSPDVRIDGDVYRVQINCSSRPPAGPGPAPAGTNCPATIVQHDAGGSLNVAWIALRATSARRPPPVFLYRPAPSAPWRILPTHRGGRDFYTAALLGEGDYALTFSAAPRSSGASHSTSARTVTVIVLVAVLAALTALIGGIRFARARQRR